MNHRTALLSLVVLVVGCIEPPEPRQSLVITTSADCSGEYEEAPGRGVEIADFAVDSFEPEELANVSAVLCDLRSYGYDPPRACLGRICPPVTSALRCVVGPMLEVDSGRVRVACGQWVDTTQGRAGFRYETVVLSVARTPVQGLGPESSE